METTQYKPGDKVVYPAHGPVEVASIETKSVAGNDMAFYILKALGSDRKIMVPVANADKVGLRTLVSNEEIDQVFDVLRSQDNRLFDDLHWHKRFKGYQDLLKTGKLLDMASVVRDLTLLKTEDGRRLSFSESQMLDSARSAIVQEIALAREVDEETISAQVDEVFEA